MNKLQNNFFNMVKTVLSVFSRSEIWCGILMIEELVDKIGDTVNRINDAAKRQQMNNTTAYTSNKDQRRTLLEDRVFLLAMRVKVFAMRTGNYVLASQMTFTRASLNLLRLNKLLAFARSIVEHVVEIVDQLEPYQVTQADVEKIQELIDSTEQLNAERDAIRTDHTENTKQLKQLFAEARAELELMDTQVRAFIDDSEFVNTYFIARKIYDVRGGGKKSGEEEVI